MSKKVTLHKANYADKVEVYQGFGRYRRIPTTVCRGGKGFYSKRPPRGYLVRNWKDVTCKNCLRHAPLLPEPPQALHYDIRTDRPVMRADAPNLKVTPRKANKKA